MLSFTEELHACDVRMGVEVDAMVSEAGIEMGTGDGQVFGMEVGEAKTETSLQAIETGNRLL